MGSFKEFYLNEFKSEIIATYLTRSGKIAFQLKKYDGKDSKGRDMYSWTGTLGAGSGSSLEHYTKEIKNAMERKKGIHFSSGIDITKD